MAHARSAGVDRLGDAAGKMRRQPWQPGLLLPQGLLVAGGARQADDVGAQAYSRTATLVTVDVWAAWLPYRTAAEHLNPADFRSVTVVRVLTNNGKQTSESRTFTSAALIGRLAAVLNSGVPAPDSATGLILGCVPGGFSYTFRFTPRAEHGPAVTASPYCDAIAVSVNGKQQPALWDDGTLETIAGPLFGR